MNEPETTIVGNVGGEPELRFTPNGHAVCKFSVAQTPRIKGADGAWKDGEPTWFNCTAWRELGEHVAESITRGMRVIIKGRFVLREYEAKDGTKGRSLDLEVDAIGPELRYATAVVSKAAKVAGGNGAGSASSGDQWGGATAERPTATATAASAETQRAAQEPATPW